MDKKYYHQNFKDIGFSIEIHINLKEEDFLDVALNLQYATYRPYKKPDNKLLYIHSLSNHPPQIIKQLPNSISGRLSKNSSNQEIFNIAKVEYKDALKKPPFSKSVSTNFAKTFLQLVEKHFPRNHKLHKIFNRKKAECSAEGNCQVNNVVYKYVVTRPLLKKVYLGLSEGEWKSCFYNHKLSWKHKEYSNKTTFLSYMWHLKSVSSETPNWKWSVLRCVPQGFIEAILIPGRRYKKLNLLIEF